MKIIRIFLLILIVIGLGFLATQRLWVPKIVERLIDKENISSLSPPQMIVNGEVDCSGICIPFDFNEYFKDREGLGASKTYTSLHTNNKVKFVIKKEIQTRNPSYDVFVDNKLAGQASGQDVSETSFSPDNKYFAFKMHSTYGASHQGTTVYVVELSKPFLILLKTKPENDKGITNLVDDGDDFIESYKWGKNSIEVITYPIGNGKSGQYYRLSAKQVWNFDLTNQQSYMENSVVTKLVSLNETDDKTKNNLPIGESFELPKFDFILPSGWYRNDLKNTSVFVTKHKVLPNIEGTEGYAYGPQMVFRIVKINDNFDSYFKKAAQIDTTIEISTTTIDNKIFVRRVIDTQETSNKMIYYNYLTNESGNIKNYTFSLYPYQEAYIGDFQTFIENIMSKLFPTRS